MELEPCDISSVSALSLSLLLSLTVCSLLWSFSDTRTNWNRISLLHGRLPPNERKRNMASFYHPFEGVPVRFCIPELNKTASEWIGPTDIIHRLHARLIPWLVAICLLAFINRANICNANIDGTTRDLSLDSLIFSNIPYILWDIPMNLVNKHPQAEYHPPGKCYGSCRG